MRIRDECAFFGSLRLRPSPSLSQRERDKFAVLPGGRGISLPVETSHCSMGWRSIGEDDVDHRHDVGDIDPVVTIEVSVVDQELGCFREA